MATYHFYIILIEPVTDYKPTINSISKRLVKLKSPEDKANNVWEHLYNLNKEIKDKRDLSHLEKKLQDEENSLKSCTFKPKIQRLNKSYDVVNKQEMNIYERTIQWRKNINYKYECK